MKLATALIVILSSFIYFPGARTEDEAVSYPTGTKIVKSSSAEGTTLASSEKTRVCSSAESSDRTYSSAMETESTTSSSSTLPPLPEATDTFDSIRNEGKLFVDKTPFMRKLMDEGGLYVLTRPNRFGKSVFLQMVRRFLEGKKEFFNDTEIAKRGNGLEEDGTWTPYPVIYIDFEKIPVTGTAAKFNRDLKAELQMIAQFYKVPKERYCLGILIRELKEKTGKPVSILVDNYDLPLLDTKLSPKLRERILGILDVFYVQIKASVDHVRLGLAVGTTKFAILWNARFSDLTSDERFSSIMGFSSKEVGQHLRPYFEKFAEKSKAKEVDEIENDAKTWYGGHRFVTSNDMKTLLNPSSTCACLREKKFGDFMGNTTLVSIIKNKMAKCRKTVEDFENFEMEVSELRRFHHTSISLQLFMLCNGFLTIIGYNEESETVRLTYPNEEVKRNLRELLPQKLVGVGERGHSRLKKALMEKNVRIQLCLGTC